MGTEEDVHIRREVTKLYMHSLCASQSCDYMSGSKGEGFLYSWSDLDITISEIDLNINIDSMHKECAYIGLRKECQPGFCKVLQSYSSCKKNCKYNYLSRITFLQINQELRFYTNSDQINRGPCFSTKYQEGYGFCYALPVHPDSSNKFLKTFQTVLEWR